MNLVENGDRAAAPEEFGTGLPVTARETFVKGVYSSLDEATACRMARLRREDGITPSCRLGCSHCCRFHILTNSIEAHALAQYIKREVSAEQIDALRLRTQRWHDWDNSRPGRLPIADVDAPIDVSDYDPWCPLLVDGACLAYPVRPVVCRTHFVCSDPLSCRAASDPESTEKAPMVLKSMVRAASPFSRAMRDRIEEAGMDFSRSRMLLPHWLAVEMGWEFAISL